MSACRPVLEQRAPAQLHAPASRLPRRSISPSCCRERTPASPWAASSQLRGPKSLSSLGAESWIMGSDLRPSGRCTGRDGEWESGSLSQIRLVVRKNSSERTTACAALRVGDSEEIHFFTIFILSTLLEYLPDSSNVLWQPHQDCSFHRRLSSPSATLQY